MADFDFLDLEEGFGETGVVGNICLAGKVLGSKSFNATVVHNILTHAWKTRASFTVVPWDNNVFLFPFEDIEDRNSVLQEGPWSIMNNLLVLKQIQDGMGIAEMDFSRCPFWIQIHGLPIEKMTRANAEIIGNRFEKLLAFETSPDNVLLARNFLRIRAEINTTLPIPKGFWLRRKSPENSDLWISYKYEKLQDYCYSCGQLGHENKSCRFVPRVEGLNPCYCQDLRTGRARKAAIPIEVIKQEVDDAEKRVEALLARRPEIQSRSSVARAVEGGCGRVETPMENLDQRTLEEVGVPQSPIRTFASKRQVTGVMLSGTGIPSEIPRLSNPQVLLCPHSAPYSEMVNSGPDPPNPNLSLNIPLKPVLTIGPTPSSSKSPSQSPLYFVTEPTSPKATSEISTRHVTSLFPSKPTIVEIIPPSSPSDSANRGSPNSPAPSLIPTNLQLTTPLSLPEKPSSPQQLDIPLTAGTPKILRLCSSRVEPIRTKNKPSRPARATSKTQCKPLSLSKDYVFNDTPMIIDSSLCEVQIQQDFVTYENASSGVFKANEAEGNPSMLAHPQGNENGLGARRPLTSQALGDMVCKNRPSILFLMETKNNKVKMETIRVKLGFDSGVYVDPEGLSGGLALWWMKEIEIDVDITSRNFIHVVISEKASSSVWAATFIYGCPTRTGRVQVWDSIREIAYSERLRWLCMGDFNQVSSVEDKLGGVSPSQTFLSDFHEMISNCGLVDLEFKGPKFTWRNNRREEAFIMERIDMAFANADWRELHEHAIVLVEAAIGSDHNPLILNTTPTLNKVGKPFKFESFWVSDAECKGVVSDSWKCDDERSKMSAVCKMLRRCKDNLKAWSHGKFGNLRLKIVAIKEQLLEIQKRLEQGFNPDCVAQEKSLFIGIGRLMAKRCNIIRLKDKFGDWKADPKEIASIIKGHFQELYNASPVRDFNDMVSLIDPVISRECNENLVREVTYDEVKLAAFQLGPLKAPGLDGFPGLFFQTY
ncbi:hypothetical protein RHSIM_Rhsim09G0068100 [Rhododendron simsii]|uniref:CCHC-type domain-containing protein n=1 Tax=Rhododendron simsii TaxID=118357 RepID=A0A834GJ36_RHOSS|nr:hypothetical protein RHSIM_Rhsim09G0068100 [Rhododendron simsii]